MHEPEHSQWGLARSRPLFSYFLSRVMRPEEMDAIFPINCVFIVQRAIR
jgi:hypothetical protein